MTSDKNEPNPSQPMNHAEPVNGKSPTAQSDSSESSPVSFPNFEPIPAHSKSAEEAAIITKGLNNNRLVRFLDDDQKNALVALCHKEVVPKGRVVLKQGAPGHHFYVVGNGELEAYTSEKEKNKHVIAHLGPGTSFGEQGMIFDTARSASVVANLESTLFVVDRDTFWRVLKASKRLRIAFHKHAEMIDDEPQMTSKGFAQYLQEGSGEADPRLQALFRLADKDASGALSFEEFCVFELVSNKPDPSFDFVFLLYDRERKGHVSFNDFKAIMSKTSNFPFDYDCSMVNRFFGKNRKKKLFFYQFSQFFNEVQRELPKQIFLRLDKDKNGRLTRDEFLELCGFLGDWRLPPSLKKRLKEKKYLYSPGGVDYAEVVAFNNVLSSLAGVRAIIDYAQKSEGVGAVTRAKYKMAAQQLMATSSSPLEVEIVFSLLDEARRGYITTEDFDAVCMARNFKAQVQKTETKKSSFLSKLTEAVSNFFIGGLAGAIGIAVVYPVDLVKTRLQAQTIPAGAPGAQYNGIADCFRKIVRSEGTAGLYKGIVPQVLGVAPEKAIKLAVNDLLRDLFEDKKKGKIYLPLEVLAGAGGGAAQVMFTNPYEIIKIRLQLQSGPARKNAVQILKEVGLSNVYKGAGACLARDSPFAAIYFPAYAACKQRLSDNGKSPITMPDLLLAGAIAGIPAAWLTTPADVIKTRLQMEAKAGGDAYKGIRDCFWKITREEGAAALFKGSTLRVMRSSPQFGVTLLAYEVLQKWIAPNIAYAPPVNAPVSTDDVMTMRKDNILSKLVPVGSWQA